MLKFFTKVSGPKYLNGNPPSSSSAVQQEGNPSAQSSSSSVRAHDSFHPTNSCSEINLDELNADPGLRKSIHEFPVNDRENVRRAYLQKGPCQPRNHLFPSTRFSGVNRSFVSTWFNEYNWLEYSISKDAAYCLVCYLFKPNFGHQGGGDSFVGEGFKNWKKKDRFRVHVGDHSSVHNQCSRACNDLMLQRQHVEVCISKQTDKVRADYRLRLTASVDCIRFLLRQGLGFRGHDESENSLNIVKITKQELQRKRDGGWESLLSEVSLFCIKHRIIVPNMESNFQVNGRSRRNVQECTNLHFYQVELFYSVLDSQLQELNNRFTELNTELLLCMSCLDPMNSFSADDTEKLIRFATLYPSDFDEDDLLLLEYQLTNYIADVRTSGQFNDVVGISGLSRKMVQTKRHRQYPLVFLLIKLALILPVATATVERVFSAMKIVKTHLRNRLGDEFMNDCLVAYIEREMSATVNNEDIIQTFQNMMNRRGLL